MCAISALLRLLYHVQCFQTVLLDCSLSQYKPYRNICPQPHTAFCLFHQGVKPRCNSQHSMRGCDKLDIFRWLPNLVLKSYNSEYAEFFGATVDRSTAASTLLKTPWISHRLTWFAYFLYKHLLLEHCTNNLADAKNRHLKENPLCH